MNIYWNANERNNKGLPGRKQPIDYYFDYAGKRRCIPAIYRFPEGIVFDILTMLDEAELRAFLDKYQGMEEALTPAQRRAVEGEHPYQAVSLREIKINDNRPLNGWSSTSSFHLPWMESYAQLEKEAKAYKNQLEGASCFVCERFTFPFCPEPISKWQRLRRWLFPKQINRIVIEISKTTRFLPIESSFTLPYDFSDVHIETFRHPQTQMLHTLYFQGIEHEEVQLPTDRKRKTLHATWLSYEIDPALPEGDRLQFDSSIQWEPEPIEANGFYHHSTSAAAIGIIGGADGPTAIFLAGQNNPDTPRGTHGLPLHSCLSKPSVRVEPTINVVLDGINIDWLDAEMLLWEL